MSATKQGGRADALSQSEIHQITGLEVDFGNATCAFDHDEIVLGREPVVSREHVIKKSRKVFVVSRSAEITPDTPVHELPGNPCPSAA